MQIASHSPSTTCVSLDAVNFAYKPHELILENISFSINHGDYLGVLGPNGGGKTTLIKIILGLLTPQSGVIKIGELSPSTKQSRLMIGYVPQKAADEQWNFPVTVEELVLMGRTVKTGILHRYAKKDFIAQENALSITDMLPYRTKQIRSLSGGLRQRALIARALASEPSILILDEPSTGVDIATQEKFYTLLKSLNQQKNLTIVFVSHDLEILARETTSVLCVNRTLIYHGPTKEALREEHLEELYGKKIAFAVHRH